MTIARDGFDNRPHPVLVTTIDSEKPLPNSRNLSHFVQYVSVSLSEFAVRLWWPIQVIIYLYEGVL